MIVPRHGVAVRAVVTVGTVWETFNQSPRAGDPREPHGVKRSGKLAPGDTI